MVPWWFGHLDWWSRLVTWGLVAFLLGFLRRNAMSRLHWLWTTNHWHLLNLLVVNSRLHPESGETPCLPSVGRWTNLENNVQFYGRGLPVGWSKNGEYTPTISHIPLPCPCSWGRWWSQFIWPISRHRLQSPMPYMSNMTLGLKTGIQVQVCSKPQTPILWFMIMFKIPWFLNWSVPLPLSSMADQPTNMSWSALDSPGQGIRPCKIRLFVDFHGHCSQTNRS